MPTQEDIIQFISKISNIAGGYNCNVKSMILLTNDGLIIFIEHYGEKSSEYENIMLSYHMSMRKAHEELSNYRDIELVDISGRIKELKEENDRFIETVNEIILFTFSEIDFIILMEYNLRGTALFRSRIEKGKQELTNILYRNVFS